MKDILVVLLLIAVVILVFGAVNQDQRLDFDYIFGTWEHVSAFSLAGIGAGLTFLVGFCAAAVARMRVLGDRHKLEKELEQVYVRLRAAEQGTTAAPPAAAAVAPSAVSAAPEQVPAMPAAETSATEAVAGKDVVAAPDQAAEARRPDDDTAST